MKKAVLAEGLVKTIGETGRALDGWDLAVPEGT